MTCICWIEKNVSKINSRGIFFERNKKKFQFLWKIFIFLKKIISKLTLFEEYKILQTWSAANVLNAINLAPSNKMMFKFSFNDEILNVCTTTCLCEILPIYFSSYSLPTNQTATACHYTRLINWITSNGCNG